MDLKHEEKKVILVRLSAFATDNTPENMAKMKKAREDAADFW